MSWCIVYMFPVECVQCLGVWRWHPFLDVAVIEVVIELPRRSGWQDSSGTPCYIEVTQTYRVR